MLPLWVSHFCPEQMFPLEASPESGGPTGRAVVFRPKGPLFSVGSAEALGQMSCSVSGYMERLRLVGSSKFGC